MKVDYKILQRFVSKVFESAGCDLKEADTIAKHLVGANLAGHDSHGVIRASYYIKWLRERKVLANQHISIITDGGNFVLTDGNFGFGQVIGEEAVRLGIERAKKHNIAIIGLRNSGHLGRIGDWPIMAAEEGFISLHFVNSTGFSILAAPFGGTDRRLSSNPLSFGVPNENKRHIILDMATCKVAEGKIMVAVNEEKELPDDYIIDSAGKPTKDPNLFFANPPGAILPLSPGHKGFGLSVICELLAGALTGGHTTNPNSPTAKRMINNMLSIYVNPNSFTEKDEFFNEIKKLTDWVKASPPASPEGKILMPGEPEENVKSKRTQEGVPIDEKTINQLVEAGKSVGLKQEEYNLF